jgi:predicted ester cyclase
MVDNKQRARAFWDELFNSHDLQRVEDFIAPASVNHNAREGTPHGPQGARETFLRLWHGFPDMHFDLQTMVAEGDKVVCIGSMSGTHDGPFQGMAATRARSVARHIHVLTFDDAGLITDHLAVRDDITMLRQLGLLPEDVVPETRRDAASD